jgi:hypothetical protein
VPRVVEDVAINTDYFRKEILWESETATDAEVSIMERHFIRETGANNPAVGYNLTPRWPESL